MKAKMIDKPVEAGRYLCSKCQSTFKLAEGKLECPNCHNRVRNELVLIYVKDNPDEEKMYTNEDWHGG